MRIIQWCGIALLCILSIGLATAAPRRARTAELSCEPAGCQAFIPAARFDVLPRLIAPSGSSTSLAPTLLWSPLTLGIHRVQVSSDSTFLSEDALVIDSTRNVSKVSDAPIGTLVSSNLKPSTMYFWRVGAQTAKGTLYAEPQSFTTPSADAGTLPGVVAIVEPKVNAQLRRDSVLLKWRAAPGALLYRIRMTDSSGKSFSPGTAYVEGSETTFWVTGVQRGQTYTWKIRAYNSFGWGSYSDERSFTMK